MPTKLEGQCARQECCIHEQTLSEWQIIGHRLRPVENESGGRIRARNAVAGETYCDICKVKRGLIDCDGWCSGRLGREGDLPGTFAIAAVLNEGVRDKIHGQRDEKCEHEVFDRIIRFHEVHRVGAYLDTTPGRAARFDTTRSWQVNPGWLTAERDNPYRYSRVIHRRRGEPRKISPQPPVNNSAATRNAIVNNSTDIIICAACGDELATLTQRYKPRASPARRAGQNEYSDVEPVKSTRYKDFADQFQNSATTKLKSTHECINHYAHDKLCRLYRHRLGRQRT